MPGSHQLTSRFGRSREDRISAPLALASKAAGENHIIVPQMAPEKMHSVCDCSILHLETHESIQITCIMIYIYICIHIYIYIAYIMLLVLYIYYVIYIYNIKHNLYLYNIYNINIIMYIYNKYYIYTLYII